jgi:A/G-specific adenine glycosylase
VYRNLMPPPTNTSPEAAPPEPAMPDDVTLERLRMALLDWYDRHARVLPWRVGPADVAAGLRQDPYRVWLSEIMLQQTTVAAVAPRFARFLEAAPTVQALAGLPVERVMELWAGLGYYARARNLHACAKQVAEAGGFPQTLAGLTALPGVGDYTARAVGAIAFDLPVTPVDGNVERVLSRLVAVEQPLPRAKPLYARLASAFDGGQRPGDFAQALMDLGATVCTPRAPDCPACPWQDACTARRSGTPDAWPRKAKKGVRPARRGAVVVITDGMSVVLRRRPESGLLGGMLELPGTDWIDQDGPVACPVAGEAIHAGVVQHVFTHFTLQLDVWRLDIADLAGQAGLVTPIDGLEGAALPTVMRKALAAGLPRSTRR